MAKRAILVDSARRELEKHGTETFPMIVNHDDLWSFEGKNVPIHWHNDLEINLIREGEAVFQVYQKSYRVRTGEGFLLNRNVPHSCSSPGNEHVRYSTILVSMAILEVMLSENVFNHFCKIQRYPVFI